MERQNGTVSGWEVKHKRLIEGNNSHSKTTVPEAINCGVIPRAEQSVVFSSQEAWLHIPEIRVCNTWKPDWKLIFTLGT
jgi:hypothetical protein